MAISGDYSTPVQVNGFSCRNCTDVALAKKHIDPEHPKSGPYGIDAKNDPSLQGQAAVVFGGSQRDRNATGYASTDVSRSMSLARDAAASSGIGNQVDRLV